MRGKVFVEPIRGDFFVAACIEEWAVRETQVRAMNAKDDTSSDLQPKKHDDDDDDAQDETSRDNMVWNNDWDDNDSTLGDRALESQRILGYPNGSGGVIDEDEEAIEDEIRANLSSKITSSLHAYKIAGIALIITLISFTINTV